MESKKILITIHETPLGDIPIHENLRTALGLTAGYKEHKLDIVFTGDSVYLVHMPQGNKLLNKFITSFNLIDANIHFDEKSFEERNIDKNLVKEPFRLVNRDGIFDMLKKASLNMSF